MTFQVFKKYCHIFKKNNQIYTENFKYRKNKVAYLYFFQVVNRVYYKIY